MAAIFFLKLTMKRLRLIIILILVAISGISIGYWFYNWFYNNFEKISENVEIGYQGEARDNPLLAAERLLERMGTPTKTIQSLSDIDLNMQDTLILYNTPISEEESNQLHYWIEAGGHLIIANKTGDDYLSTIPLFTQLGITQYQNYLDEAEIAQSPPLEFFWARYRLQVAFNPDYYLKSGYYDPAKKIADEHGTHLLFYYYSTGMLTILSDLAFFENYKIDKYDHAQFLWHLVHFKRQAERVWLLHTQADMNGTKKNVPSLWALLWINMWTIIISATTLLLFWLWLISRRFGTLLPAPPRARRRLLEHIEASGHFFWRQNQAQILLHAARQAVLKRLDSEHPYWARLSQAQLSQHLAQISELPADEIEKALHGNKHNTEIAFTRAIQILTQIRKKL